MKTIQEQINEQHARIISAKNDLYGKDYIGHKVIDAIIGVLTEPSPTIGKVATAVKGILSEYPDYLNAHQTGRADINDAQAVIEELEAQKQQEEANRPEPPELNGGEV